MFKVLGTFIGVIGFSKILVESGIYVSSTMIHIVDREHMKKTCQSSHCFISGFVNILSFISF